MEMFLTAILLLCLLCFSSGQISNDRHRLVRDPDNPNRIYLLYLHYKIKREVPNSETIRVITKDLEYNVAGIPIIDKQDFDEYIIHDKFGAIPSLNRALKGTKKKHSPDDLMYFQVQEILVYNPPIYWKDTYSLPNMVNPAIGRWRGKYCLIYRKKLIESEIRFTWIDIPKNSTIILQNDTIHGMGFNITPNITTYDFNLIQEDPRFLSLDDDHAVIQYTAKITVFTQPKQCYVILKYDSQQDLVEYHPSILMDGHHFQVGQKNWVLIHHHNRHNNHKTIANAESFHEHSHIHSSRHSNLHFLQTINPMRILQPVAMVDINNPLNRSTVMKTLYEHPVNISLPWKRTNGPSIRGGTPTVYLKKYQLYLAFFHTNSRFLVPHYYMQTYFMGAMTFCPQLPYKIHSMSDEPIVQPELYDGEWISFKNINYCVFPIGLVVEKSDNDSEEEEFLLLSFGHQDKHGKIARINIKELLSSLHPVANCTM